MRYAIISRILTVAQLQNEVVKSGGRNLKVFPASQQVFTNLDDAGVAKLRAIGCIINKIAGVEATVMPPTPIAGIAGYTAQEYIDIAGLERLRGVVKPALYGEGTTLAIIGSGIRETHEQINGRVIFSKNYTTSPDGDNFDHDTGVAAIAITLAPMCGLLDLKVLDDEGMGTEEEVVEAIEDCCVFKDQELDIAPNTINLSLGAPDEGNPDSPMRVACRAAMERGIWIKASAGNAGPTPTTITSPACEEFVFAIGSAKYLPEQQTYEVSDFSSRGPTKEGLIKPDLVTFGQDIIVASSKSNTATIAKSGTSFAAPIASGFGLLWFEGVRRGGITLPEVSIHTMGGEPGYAGTSQEVMAYMDKVAGKPAGTVTGKDNEMGYGMPIGEVILQYLGTLKMAGLTDIFVPIISLAFMGMIMSTVGKAFK